MSVNAFFASFANLFHTTEQEILDIISNIKTGEQVVAADINKGLAWVVANAPSIASSIQQVETLISDILAVTPGLSGVAAVNKAIQEANTAVTALNAFATASNTGSNNAAALVQGYVAFQTAAAAAASAKATAASVSTPTSK